MKEEKNTTHNASYKAARATVTRIDDLRVDIAATTTAIGVELGLMDAAERAGLIAAELLGVPLLLVAALGLPGRAATTTSTTTTNHLSGA